MRGERIINMFCESIRGRVVVMLNQDTIQLPTSVTVTHRSVVHTQQHVQQCRNQRHKHDTQHGRQVCTVVEGGDRHIHPLSRGTQCQQVTVFVGEILDEMWLWQNLEWNYGHIIHQVCTSRRRNYYYMNDINDNITIIFTVCDIVGFPGWIQTEELSVTESWEVYTQGSIKGRLGR